MLLQAVIRAVIAALSRLVNLMVQQPLLSAADPVTRVPGFCILECNVAAPTLPVSPPPRLPHAHLQDQC